MDSMSKIPDKIDEVVKDNNIYKPFVDGLKEVFKSTSEGLNKEVNEFLKTLGIEFQQNSETINARPRGQEQPQPYNERNTTSTNNSQPQDQITVPVRDFVIKALPEDTIKVIGGTNIPPAGADITNILNNQTNNTQALTSIQPITPREIATQQAQANATPVANEEKEIRVKFDPFIVKLEGDGKSIEMALQDNVVRDKIIDMVSKAMTSDYNTMGRPLLGNRA
jgi:hypothetical protein